MGAARARPYGPAGQCDAQGDRSHGYGAWAQGMQAPARASVMAPEASYVKQRLAARTAAIFGERDGGGRPGRAAVAESPPTGGRRLRRVATPGGGAYSAPAAFGVAAGVW